MHVGVLWFAASYRGLWGIQNAVNFGMLLWPWGAGGHSRRLLWRRLRYSIYAGGSWGLRMRMQGAWGPGMCSAIGLTEELNSARGA